MAIRVLHLGAGRYRADDRQHPTFDIWRNLSRDSERYAVVGRSADGAPGALDDGRLSVTLLRSVVRSEAEFLLTQFSAVRVAEKMVPDVVIAQCPALGGLAARLIASKMGARTLLEFHGSHYFSSGNPLSKDSVLRNLARLTVPAATRIRALSNGMRNRIIEQFGPETEAKITVIPPRVDLSVFRHIRRNYRIAGRPKVVLVGAINENKGQLRFLKAVLCSELELEAIVVGEGPELDACKRFVAETPSRSVVRFLGRLSHEKLAEVLPEADAFVLYSRTEGTPRVVVEAMAAGLPIVTTDTGFTSDIVSLREGILLGTDPDAEIVACLTKLFSDDAARMALGTAGRARVEQEYAGDVVFPRYRALLAETAAATVH